MSAATQELPRTRPQLLPLGRCFVGPWFDSLLIGGGASLLVFAALWASGRLGPGRIPQDWVLVILLLVNSSHFAASTVRLYSKPGAYRELPFMTMGLPLVSLAVVLLALLFPTGIGDTFYALFLTWSPYHYAAQTYGLAAMYAMRSGCTLGETPRRLLWWTCMLPFAYAFLGSNTAGLGWFLSPELMASHPALIPVRAGLEWTAGTAVFAAPALLVWRIHRESPVGLPAISILLLLSNGLWWTLFPYMSAIVWITVFHGVQYLAIVIIFHLRDHPPQGGGRAAWLWPSVKFYAACLGLAYALFELWPWGFSLLGFSYGESVLVCVAAINIHHFIVDRGIWRVRRDPNYRHVVAG